MPPGDFLVPGQFNGQEIVDVMEVIDWMKNEIISSPLVSQADKESRADRWASGFGVTPDGGPRPSWATLAPDHSEGFRHWAEVLAISHIDAHTIQDLQYLVKGGHFGWSEGCRLLAHFWKDGENEFLNPSGWFRNGIREALEAIRNQDEWDFNGNGEPPNSGRPAGVPRDPWREYYMWQAIIEQQRLEALSREKGQGKGDGFSRKGKGKGRGALYRR